MSQHIRAIYEDGLFRPLDPVALTQREVVSLVIVPAPPDESSAVLPPDGDRALAEQQAALQEMFAEADALPLEVPDDQFDGADHDFILYGWKK